MLTLHDLRAALCTEEEVWFLLGFTGVGVPHP